MTVSSKEREARKVKVLVDRDVVDTSFEKWAKPGPSLELLLKAQKQQLGSGIYMPMHMILTVKQIH